MQQKCISFSLGYQVSHMNVIHFLDNKNCKILTDYFQYLRDTFLHGVRCCRHQSLIFHTIFSKESLFILSRSSPQGYSVKNGVLNNFANFLRTSSLKNNTNTYFEKDLWTTASNFQSPWNYKILHWPSRSKKTPVDTWRRFNVYKTLQGLWRHIDVLQTLRPRHLSTGTTQIIVINLCIHENGPRETA